MIDHTEHLNFYLSNKSPSNTHIITYNDETLHSHDFIEVSIITAGKIKHSFANKCDVLNERDIVVIPTDKAHQYTRFNNIDCQHRDIMLDPDLTKQIFRTHFSELYDLLFVKKTILSQSLNHESITAIVYYVDVITRKDSISKELHLSATIGLIYLLGTIFSEKISPVGNRKNIPECIRRIILATKSHEIFFYTWQEIYYLSNYSKEYTCRQFRSIMNCTITEYINQERLNYAAELLLNTFLSLNQILDKINMSSESYFIRIFKKQFGCSPFEYRKRHTNPI